MIYELSQNGNVFFRGWEDPAVIQERLNQANELEAELERVKAEREAWQGTAKGYMKQRDKFLSRLADLKSRLPKNADEENPSIDWKQFVMDDEGELVEFIIASMHKESGEVYVQGSVECEPFGYVTPLLKDCHSTAESCRAAAEGGGKGE